MSTDSPKVTRYRLVKGYSSRLTYRDGVVEIGFRGDQDHCWKLYARKGSDESTMVEIMRGGSNMREWSELRFSGFDVSTGSAADKIMRKLVREGQAFVLGTDEIYGESIWDRNVRLKRLAGRTS